MRGSGGSERNVDFLKLWAGQTVSVFGSLVGGAALQFTAILTLRATAFEMGLLAAAGLVPRLFAGLLAGAWIDRVRRRPILIGADVGRFLLLATIPLAAALQLLRIEQLYLIAFLAGLLRLLYDLANRAYLPGLVGAAHLIDANSRLAASSSAAEIGGFGVAGWLVQLLSAPLAILVDAGSFLISALLEGAIARPEPVPGESAERQSLWLELRAGVTFVLADPLLRSLAVSAIILELAFSIFGAVIILFVTRDLRIGPGVQGVIWGIGGVSSLLGAVAAGRVVRRFGVGPVMIAALLIFGLTQILIPTARGPVFVVLLMLGTQQLLGDFSEEIYAIQDASLRQALSPPRFLGRVEASISVVGVGAMLAGSLLAGMLGDRIGLRATLLVGCCGTFTAALWLLLSPLRTLKSMPALPLEQA